MECTKAPRRGTAAAMIGTLAVMLACAAGADGAQPREIPRDQFGAAHAAFQEAELAKLLPAGDVTKAPAGFDPVIWEAFKADSEPRRIYRTADDLKALQPVQPKARVKSDSDFLRQQGGIY